MQSCTAWGYFSIGVDCPHKFLRLRIGDRSGWFVVRVVKVKKGHWRGDHKADAGIRPALQRVQRLVKRSPTVRSFDAGMGKPVAWDIGDFLLFAFPVYLCPPHNPLR